MRRRRSRGRDDEKAKRWDIKKDAELSLRVVGFMHCQHLLMLSKTIHFEDLLPGDFEIFDNGK